jgi:hypothetical protein
MILVAVIAIVIFWVLPFILKLVFGDTGVLVE